MVYPKLDLVSYYLPYMRGLSICICSAIQRTTDDLKSNRLNFDFQCLHPSHVCYPCWTRVFLLFIIKAHVIHVEVWTGAPTTRSILTQLWMSVGLLPHCNRQLIQLLIALWKGVVMGVNPIMIVRKR